MRLRTLGPVVAATLLLTGCGSPDASEAPAADPSSAEPSPTAASEATPTPSGPTPLATALSDCEDAVSAFLQQTETDGDPGTASSLSEDGSAVTVAVTDPDADPDLAYYVLTCLFDETGAPATTADDLLATTEEMGEQQVSWDGYAASWTFDLDSGYAGDVRATD